MGRRRRDRCRRAPLPDGTPALPPHACSRHASLCLTSGARQAEGHRALVLVEDVLRGGETVRLARAPTVTTLAARPKDIYREAGDHRQDVLAATGLRLHVWLMTIRTRGKKGTGIEADHPRSRRGSRWSARVAMCKAWRS